MKMTRKGQTIGDIKLEFLDMIYKYLLQFFSDTLWNTESLKTWSKNACKGFLVNKIGESSRRDTVMLVSLIW